ncbi:MAG: hypothetical protein WCD76_02620 [Pyrinomonadaceae bacterium]
MSKTKGKGQSTQESTISNHTAARILALAFITGDDSPRAQQINALTLELAALTGCATQSLCVAVEIEGILNSFTHPTDQHTQLERAEKAKATKIHKALLALAVGPYDGMPRGAYGEAERLARYLESPLTPPVVCETIETNIINVLSQATDFNIVTPDVFRFVFPLMLADTGDYGKAFLHTVKETMYALLANREVMSEAEEEALRQYVIGA